MTPYDAFQSFDTTIGIRKTIPYSIVENYLYYLPGKSPTLKLYSRGFHIETLKYSSYICISIVDIDLSCLCVNFVAGDFERSEP